MSEGSRRTVVSSAACSHRDRSTALIALLRHSPHERAVMHQAAHKSHASFRAHALAILNAHKGGVVRIETKKKKKNHQKTENMSDRNMISSKQPIHRAPVSCLSV